MCKRLIVSFIFVLSLAAISCGEVIGDWEQNMDGWTDLGGCTLSYTLGGTLHDYALKVVAPAPAWYQPIIDKVLTGDQVASIANGTNYEFKLDVERFAADWIPGAWGWWTPESRLFFSLSATAYNEDGVQKSYGAGQEVLGAAWYPSSIPPGHFPPGPRPISKPYPDPDGWMTAVWSLDAQRAAIQDLLDQGYIYDMVVDVKLIANTPDYYGPVTYCLDNAQLIPEPATMALLGLGLALIRRKR